MILHATNTWPGELLAKEFCVFQKCTETEDKIQRTQKKIHQGHVDAQKCHPGQKTPALKFWTSSPKCLSSYFPLFQGICSSLRHPLLRNRIKYQLWWNFTLILNGHSYIFWSTSESKVIYEENLKVMLQTQELGDLPESDLFRITSSTSTW